jgi:multiple sugar transport system substrate-binding protein
MQMNRKISLIAVFLLAGIVSGCGGKADNNGQSAAKNADMEPVTLEVFNQIALSDDDWKRLVEEPLKKKYPNVTLTKTTGGKSLDLQIAEGYRPDIVLSGFYFLGDLFQLKIPASIEDYVQKNKTDLNRFDSLAVNELRKDGKLYGLPFYMNKAALVYNKDLFDKFGVAYPKDDMTWDDAVELAKKMTRFESGVQYIGLYPSNWDLLASQLSLQKIDTATNKAMVNSEGHKKVFRVLDHLFSIPGNRYIENIFEQQKLFFKEQSVAMLTYWVAGLVPELEKLHNAGTPINWDMVTLPSFADKKGIGAKVDAHVFLISDQSKNKDNAFEVIQYLTTSKEVQTEVVKTGKFPSTADQEVIRYFGQNYNSLKGKNVDKVIKMKSATLHTYHMLENSTVNKPMAAAQKKVFAEKVDINTALRQAEEEINKNIEAQSLKK